MTCKRPPYEMPYSYFADEREKHWKKKNMYDIDVWIKRNTSTFVGENIIAPNDTSKLMEGSIGSLFQDGFFGDRSRFHRASNIENKFSGHPAFIFCPGPSLKAVDLEAFSGCLTIAVNSAGFAFPRKSLPYLWGVAEAEYMSWFYRQDFCRETTFLWNHRTAFRYISRHGGLNKKGDKLRIDWHKMLTKFKAAFIHTWEAEKTIPPRTSAPSTTAALVAAWKLGCDSAYVVGMDLSKHRGETYLSGLPHTTKGRDATFKYQLKSLGQFHIPGFTVYNGSPHSKRRDKGLPFVQSNYKEITDIARSSDSVPDIKEFI